MRRGLRLALLCVLTPFAAFAQGVRLDNIAFATRGVPLPNPIVTVCTSAGSGQPCAPLATVYTNSTLTTTAANPLPIVAIGQVSAGAGAGVDAARNYGAWLPPGRYVLTISGSGVTTPITMTVTLPCDSTTGTTCSLSASSVTAATVTDSGLTPGNCVQATTGGQLTTVSGACGTSSGTITATGSPASGNLSKFSGATSITNGDLSGDCTTSGTLAATCTKTNGTAFAPSATTDTTNASNISSGTLAAARVAQISLAASGNGGVSGVLPVANEGTGTPAAGKYVDGGTGAWTALPSASGYKIECVNSSPVTVTNTASETVLMSCSIPANELGNNQVLRLYGAGTLTTSATQTLTMRVRIGGLAGTVLGASDAAIANSSGGSWNLEFKVIANGAPSGSTATECQGMFVWNNGTTTPLGTTLSNGATVSWATNSTLSLVITQAWSAAVTATVTERQMIVERLN